MSNEEDLLVVAGRRYWKQKRWAKDRNINSRTVERYRQRGLSWLPWGGEIYIPEAEGDEFIASRVIRRNTPRRQRQTVEISAP